MELLERARVLEELDGEAGIGKSALVRRFTERHQAGARFLLGACDPLLTPRALGPLHDIARQTGGPASPARPPPQAGPDPRRAAGLGHGRRLRPDRPPDPGGPGGRADLLGELHASGPLLPLRPGGRHLGREHGPHRREGVCHVIGVAPAARFSEVPASMPDRDRLWRGAEPHGDWMLDGYSVIVGPTGTVPAGASSTRSATTTGSTCSAWSWTTGPSRTWCRSPGPEPSRRASGVRPP